MVSSSLDNYLQIVNFYTDGFVRLCRSVICRAIQITKTGGINYINRFNSEKVFVGSQKIAVNIQKQTY